MHDYYSGIHLSYSPDFQALFVARFGRFGWDTFSVRINAHTRDANARSPAAPADTSLRAHNKHETEPLRFCANKFPAERQKPPLPLPLPLHHRRIPGKPSRIEGRWFVADFGFPAAFHHTHRVCLPNFFASFSVCCCLDLCAGGRLGCRPAESERTHALSLGERLFHFQLRNSPWPNSELRWPYHW